jgi:uncharacterized protein YndB with AHSA1/START domain
MAPRKGLPIPSLDLTVVINAPPRPVLRAFFEADALAAWWQVTRSVTTPRALGPYVVEWPPAEFRDDIVGRLGGVFRGTVMQFDAGRGFFVADAYWLPPDGEPIGPMALEVTCDPESSTSESAADTLATKVTVRQTGFEESPRWRRYYEIATVGWQRALASLKQLLESSNR